MNRYINAVTRRLVAFLPNDVARVIGKRRKAPLRRANIETGLADSIALIFRHHLGRDADADELQSYTNALRSGVSISQIIHEVGTSEEALLKRQDIEKGFRDFVNLVYRFYLGRDADPHGLQHYTDALRAGTSISHIIHAVETSEEARLRIASLKELDIDSLSDGKFILHIIELCEARGANAADIEHWREFLREDPIKRNELFRKLMSAYIYRQAQNEHEVNNPHTIHIMGTDQHITRRAWEARAREVSLATPMCRLPKPMGAQGEFTHSGQYVVSAIVSLYKGRRFISGFLDNITSQTIFDQSELIIVDADSPESEHDIIAAYQMIYPNIIYKRINYCIGIYDAWNVGVSLARGKYLTNANVDDLRRKDSFEIQAGVLELNPFVDVVYQDFFYTFDYNLSFDEIARMGFRSDLPIVTANNLLFFNSPHNAPMWRKALHEELGLFDASFQSAGDWEFWLRCLWRGKRFFKSNSPHVAYFQNPEGISTKPETCGPVEIREVSRRYCRRLLSSYLLMSRKDFATSIGADPNWDWGKSYYDVVQEQLKLLGEQRMRAP